MNLNDLHKAESIVVYMEDGRRFEIANPDFVRMDFPFALDNNSPVTIEVYPKQDNHDPTKLILHSKRTSRRYAKNRRNH